MIALAHDNSEPTAGGSCFIRRWLRNKLDTASFEADRALAERKRELLAHARGTVLEIGAGVGINRKYLSKASRYLALEPNEIACDNLRQVTPNVLCSCAEDIPLPTSSVDTVVCSMALCSVEDTERVLSEIYRVLRDGGELYAIEHVAAPSGSLLRLAQRAARPICRHLEFGCRPDRDIEHDLRRCALTVFSVTSWAMRLKPPLVRDWISARLVKQ